MATDATTNGVYDNHYSQPAELAASTPSASSTSAQASGANNKADPQEIGWYFVEQFYTTLSKSPERIHLFYSKKSQLINGVEADKVVPCVGSKAIGEKIKSLDIQDCKVRVLNVDCLSSFDNIVVQVIGEMSNKGHPSQKFVQTFVLATQPNGYYVLNDIFRYLNDEEPEIVDDQSAEESAPVAEPTSEVEIAQPSAASEVVNNEEAVAAVDEKLETAQEPAVVESEAENIQEHEEAAAVPEAADEATITEPITLTQEQPAEPEPTPVVETPPKVAQEQSQVPPAKKTWASLVGNKAPAVPALPTAPAVPAQPKAQKQPQAAPATKANPATKPTAEAAPAPAPAAPSIPDSNEWQTADRSKKTKGQETKAGSESVVHAYIKNVTEKVDARELKRLLESFGELKYYDVSRPRNCAFVEFADTAGYLAAVAANPHTVGGEQISVEERRIRQGNYNNSSGRGRGGFQKEGGRGNFQQRGGKSGNVTPKGRGQPQAS